MYREIKKKKLILENRKPFSREATGLIEELNRLQWIHSSLVLDGCRLSRPMVEALLKGEFFPDVSLGDHMAVNNFNLGVELVNSLIAMGNELNKDILLKILDTISGGNVKSYRQSNPVLRMLNYNPPHFKEVENQMDMVFQRYNMEKLGENPIAVAAGLHNSLIEIYPYESHSEAMARMAANYHLMTSKLPPAAWNMSEQEYFDALGIYLKNEDSGPIYNMLERSIFNGLEVMIQLTAD